MVGAECDFCGITQGDLPDGFDTDDMVDVFFEVSNDGRSMACQGCAVGREGFSQWTVC